MSRKKLTICVISNGSQLMLNRTLASLQEQTVRDFSCKVLDLSEFSLPERNSLIPDADYVLYVYSGSVLEKDAAKHILAAADKQAPGWMYFDERNYSAVYCKDPEGIMEKPDFDLLNFSGRFFPGEGLVFSREILEGMTLNYEGKNAGVALAEMAARAAAQCDGMHIREMLLTRHGRRPMLPDEQQLLRQCWKQLLSSRYPRLLAVEKTDSPDVGLTPVEIVPQEYSVIVLSDGRGDADAAGWDCLRDSCEVIRAACEGSYWDALIQSVRAASCEKLCVVSGGCLPVPSGELNKLFAFLDAADMGSVSPQVWDSRGVAYAGICTYAGSPAPIIGERDRFAGLDRDVLAVRTVSTPARQLWVTCRQLLLEVLPRMQAVPGIDDMSADMVLTELAYQFRSLGKQNLYVGSVRVFCETQPEYPRGFCSQFFRRKGDFFPDPCCPVSARAWLRRDVLKDVRAYFPEEGMLPYDPRQKKILVYTHELSLTGAPIVLTHAVRILKEEGYQILVVCPEDGVLKRHFLRDGIPVVILGDVEKQTEWLDYARDFDLIFVNTVVPFRQIERLREFPVPVLWWLHDARSGYEDYLRHVLPETLGSNIHTFSVSRYADDVVKTYRPKYKTDLLLYGLKDEAPQLEQKLVPIEGAEDRKVFVSVGTVIHRKGQDILAQAVRLLPEEVRKQCLFLVIGKCIDTEIYRTLTDLQEAFPEEVRLIASVDHDEIFALYKQAAAVICSSRDDPLPTFMAETMMVSGVCICSENTGTAAVIRNGENGYVYHNDDPAELADCIRQVAACTDFQALKQQSRKTFEEVFSMDIFRRNLLACVNRCITRPEGDKENG